MNTIIIALAFGTASASETQPNGVRVKVDSAVWQSTSIEFEYDDDLSFMDYDVSSKGVVFGSGGRVYGGYRFPNGLELGSAVAIDDLVTDTDPSEGDNRELETYQFTFVPAVTYNHMLSESVELYGSGQYYWSSYGEEPDDERLYGYEEYVEVAGGLGIAGGSRFYLIPGASVDIGFDWYQVTSSVVDWEPNDAGDEFEYTGTIFTLRTGLSILF